MPPMSECLGPWGCGTNVSSPALGLLWDPAGDVHEGLEMMWGPWQGGGRWHLLPAAPCPGSHHRTHY